MAYAAQPALLTEVVHDAPARVHVGGYGALVHVVQQIEVKIFHSALSELVLEDRLRVVSLAYLVPGELVGQVIGLPRIPGQGAPYHQLGTAGVIRISRVEIVYAVLHGVVRHGLYLGLVNVPVAAARQQRQTHGAETQQRELYSLKIAVNHVTSHPYRQFLLQLSIKLYNSCAPPVKLQLQNGAKENLPGLSRGGLVLYGFAFRACPQPL